MLVLSVFCAIQQQKSRANPTTQPGGWYDTWYVSRQQHLLVATDRPSGKTIDKWIPHTSLQQQCIGARIIPILAAFMLVTLR